MKKLVRSQSERQILPPRTGGVKGIVWWPCPKRNLDSQHPLTSKTSLLIIDAEMPRTTLTIEDDAMGMAREYAARHHLTLGEAISDLVRRAAERPMVTDLKSGLTVVRLPEHSPRVTSERVAKVADEWP
jgi:hypothetical protein